MSDRPTKEQLIELYDRQKLSLSKVAKRYGVCAQTILNWMRGYGIPRRTLSDAWRCKTEEELRVHLARRTKGGQRYRGRDRWNWVPDGTKKEHDDYVLVKCAGHPRGNWIPEHILVMERHLGRYLAGNEEIHHRNRNKRDNRIENLQLFANHSEHLRAVNHRKKEVG